ncbi:MAG TPA: hypothetical protein VF044_00335 [Actinomycetota bacterium]
MTRYLCAHPSHADRGAVGPVDVTAQVRLERRMVPRATAYLAIADDVVRRVAAVGDRDPVERQRAVNRILTGEPAPRDGAVLLVGAGRLQRPSGLYELDALRANEPVVDDLLRRLADSPAATTEPDEIVVIEDLDGEEGPPAAGTAQVLQRAPARQRVERIPEGVYRLSELSRRLSDAGPDRDAVLAELRRAPIATGAWGEADAAPWRVVVECPVAEGDPPRTHRVVFSAPQGPEPAEVYGVPLAGREALYEEVGTTAWTPAASIHRVEARLRWLTIAIAAAAGVAIAVAWITGALGFVAREAPWTIAAAVAALGAALAVAAFTLARPAVEHANLSDTLEIRHATHDEVVFTEWATGAVAALAALALVLGVIAPVLLLADASPSVPAPSVTFGGGRRPVAATVRIVAADVASDETMWVEMRTFASATAPATTIGRVSATGDPEGRVELTQTVQTDPRDAYFSVAVWFGDGPAPVCSPTDVGDPGCTVLAVPRSSVPVAPEPAPTPPPEASVTPSPTASVTPSPTVSPTPTATGSPTATSV